MLSSNRVILASSAKVPFLKNPSFVLTHYGGQLALVILILLRFRTRFTLAIGVSTFYATTALILKRLGKVKHVVYYRIDYYPGRSFMNTLFRVLDRICYRDSDSVWSLSERISNIRVPGLLTSPMTKPVMIVPLTYDGSLLRLRPVNEIDRLSIVFVGTLEKLQGLQLLVRAMPLILRKFPKAHVKIIGDGPYGNELKNLVASSGLSENFTFFGFLKRDAEVTDIVSRSAVGVAPFVPTPDNNAMTADPGKLKLYMFLGLPVVVTKIPSGMLIDSRRAGIAIDYDAGALAEAITRLLSDDAVFEEFRSNAHNLATEFTSERVFSKALETTIAGLK